VGDEFTEQLTCDRLMWLREPRVDAI